MTDTQFEQIMGRLEDLAIDLRNIFIEQRRLRSDFLDLRNELRAHLPRRTKTA